MLSKFYSFMRFHDIDSMDKVGDCNSYSNNSAFTVMGLKSRDLL